MLFYLECEQIRLGIWKGTVTAGVGDTVSEFR